LASSWTPLVPNLIVQLQLLICVVDDNVFDEDCDQQPSFFAFLHLRVDSEWTAFLILAVFDYELLFRLEFFFYSCEFAPLKCLVLLLVKS
jgi:hypothetical protein